MSKLETSLKRELFDQLTKVGMPVADQKKLDRAILPFIDTLVRHNSVDSQSAKPVLHSYAQYVQSVHEANQQKDGDFQFDTDFKNDARQTFEQRLKDNGINIDGNLGLDTIEEGLAKLGIVSHVGSGEEIGSTAKPTEKKKTPDNLAQQDAATITPDETTDLSESQAGRSQEQLHKTFDSVYKKFVGIDDMNHRDYMIEDFLKAFKNMGKGVEGEVDLKELQNLAVLIEKAVDGDAASLAELTQAAANLSDGTKFALNEYLETLKDATLGKGLGSSVAMTLKDPGLIGQTANALYGVKVSPGNSLELGLTPELLLDRKAKIAHSVAILAKAAEFEIQQLESMGVDVDKSKIFNKFFTAENIKSAVAEHNSGLDIGKVYRDDIVHIRDFLDTNTSKDTKKVQNNFEKLFKDYGKYMFAAAPFFLAPLAGLLSQVPILGKPAASLLNWGYGLFEKAGMPLMTVMLTQGFMGGNTQNQESSEKQAETTAT
jgi:hypothetical protein